MEKVAMHQWTRHRRARTNLSLEGTGPAKAKREQRPRKKRTTPADEITEGNKFAVLDEDDLNETQGKCTARGHRSDSLHPPIQTWGENPQECQPVRHHRAQWKVCPNMLF
jgi:hypothetical protein